MSIILVKNDSMDYNKPDTIRLSMKTILSSLEEFVKQKDKILIKPNLATDRHRYGYDPRSIMAHGTVIKPIIEYFDDHEILIADNPIADADFNKILKITGLNDVNTNVLDLRTDYYPKKNAKIISHKKLPGDPKGYVIIDLKNDSEFSSISQYYKRYRTTSGTNPKKPTEVHTENHNLYSIPKSILESDIVVSVAKLKTHKKVGVTLTIKNMIGLTNRKDWIPHYRVGPPPKGDEYPKRRIFQTIHEANWYGSDTVWRASVDLMKILIYSDKKGKLHKKPQRKFFSIIDGIIGGEGEGPLAPTPKYCGIILAGSDPIEVDATAAKIMGFDPRKLKIIYNPSKLNEYRLGQLPNKYPKINLNFMPPKNWVGFI